MNIPNDTKNCTNLKKKHNSQTFCKLMSANYFCIYANTAKQQERYSAQHLKYMCTRNVRTDAKATNFISNSFSYMAKKKQ